MFDLQTIVERNKPAHERVASRYAVILSAELAENRPRQNQVATQWLAGYLQADNWSFKRLSGVYKGTAEESFLVVASGPNEVAELKHVARYYQQESVLVLSPAGDNGRRATLVELERPTAYKPVSRDNALAFLDRPVASGPFHKVSAEQARERDAYTFDPSTGDYWVADLA